MTEDRDAIDRVRQVSRDARDWTDASIRLQPLMSGKDDPVGAYLTGLSYMLTDRDSEQRERWGPFMPMFVNKDWVFPMPLKVVPDDVLERWESAAAVDDDDLIRARFADLLWVRKQGKEAFRYCITAIGAYRALARGPWRDRFQAHQCLVRAIELAQQIRNDEQLKGAIDDAYGFAVEHAHKDSSSGLAVMMVAVLAQLPAASRPPELHSLLEDLAGQQGMDANLADEIFALLVKLSSTEAEIAKWQEAQADVWGRAAEMATEGLIRLAHLERALAVARNYGLRDRMEVFRKQLQQISEEDLDLKKVSARIDVPTADVEAFIEWYVGTDGWREALTRFGARRAPAGDFQENAAKVKAQMEGSIQRLFTKMVIGPGGLPIATVIGEAAHFEVALKEHEAWAIGVWGTFASPILERIRERYGQPTPEDLTSFFTTPIIRLEVAERIARSLSLWWEGQADESAHLLLPRIETVIRDMAGRMGLVTYREPLPNEPGGVRLLGALLGDLQGRIDESWRRHLVNLLTDQLGYNLRNLVLHGLVPRVRQAEASLLINVACFLRVLQITQAPPSPPADANELAGGK